MRLASIASGSGGNCIYAGSERFHILIDAGISLKRIEAGLNVLGLSAGDIDAVLVTHEHSDHVSGLGTLLRKYHTPLFASPGTIGELEKMSVLQPFAQDCFHYVTPGNRFAVGDLSILPMRIPHDAAEPLMYRFDCGAASAAVVTDIGTATGELTQELTGLDALFLEANHDVRMLQVGPYPYFLKRRILSDHGHLSNENAGRFLAGLCSPRLRTVVLSHISKTNNYRELALEGVGLELMEIDAAMRPRLILAPEAGLSEIIEIPG